MTDLYTELMTRRATLRDAWMDYVAAWKAAGLDHTQRWSPGIVLNSDGTLWMQAKDENGYLLFELLIRPGETEVSIHPSTTN